MRGRVRPRRPATHRLFVERRGPLPNAAALPTAPPTIGSKKKIFLSDYHNELLPYEQAWAWQKAAVDHTIQTGEEHLFLVQHPPVYTLGAGSTLDNLKFDVDQPPLPLFRTERGGEVTYHGPGQLVMYPILNLKNYQPDLHWYLRSLEEVVIRALYNVSCLSGERVDGLTGVWVNGTKVAAIGVRARKWVTYHGLALNVTTELAPFSDIVPCGISDRGVTSVQQLLQQATALDDPFGDGLESSAADNLLEEYRYGLLDAFEEVFGVELEKL